MTTEENKRMLALSSIIAEMKRENVSLKQLVNHLTEDFNEAMRQLRGLEKRKDEDQPKQTTKEPFQMFIRRKELELENERQKIYIREIDSFLTEKNLYIRNGASCPFARGHRVVSISCLDCNSCLHLLDGYGVVCHRRLEGAEVKK